MIEVGRNDKPLAVQVHRTTSCSWALLDRSHRKHLCCRRLSLAARLRTTEPSVRPETVEQPEFIELFNDLRIQTKDWDMYKLRCLACFGASAVWSEAGRAYTALQGNCKASIHNNDG